MEGLMAVTAIAGLATSGLSLFNSVKQNKDMQKQFDAQMAQYDLLFNQQGKAAADLMPAAPQNPNKAIAEGTANAEAEAAAQRQQAQAAKMLEKYNPTGGMGITSSAVGSKRTLGAGA